MNHIPFSSEPFAYSPAEAAVIGEVRAESARELANLLMGTKSARRLLKTLKPCRHRHKPKKDQSLTK